ncbi:hypothetical protein [Streptomyces sp. NPDC047972]|uniref:hypothetical protein n=1 Tax=Streptomyces sp. NPDC047972 TaxID=3365493 RepID=UPI00371E4A38
MDVEEVAEELYGLRPAEFVAARDTYVARARAAKDARAAKAVAALRRPSIAAWAANRLARQRQREAQQFLALGTTLREAHRTLDAEQLRAAGAQRQELIAALARTAAALAGEAGLSVSDTVQHEIEQTLHAVLADRDVAEQWARGRLVRTPEAAVGFPAVAPEAVPPRRPPVPPPAETAGASGAGTAEGRAERRGHAGEGEEPTGAVGRSAAGRKPARGGDARRRRALERARTEAGEADGDVARRERELAGAREARQAAVEEADSSAERVGRLERELHEARRARQEARTAATAAGKEVTAAEHALREARRVAAQKARALQDLERRDGA